jgi:hypothetical protein
VGNFIAEMTAGGLATMELVARDMKQMGAYIARSLSFDGVTYSRVEHELTPIQRDIYNRLAEAWQVTLQNFKALEGAGGPGRATNSGAKGAARRLTGARSSASSTRSSRRMQMPTVLDQIEKDLAAGDAVVLQLVNTNEAQQDRALASAASDDDEDERPRGPGPDAARPADQMVRKELPVVQYEEYTDDDGNVHTRRSWTPAASRCRTGGGGHAREAAEGPEGHQGARRPAGNHPQHFGPDGGRSDGPQQRVVRKPTRKGRGQGALEKRGALGAAPTPRPSWPTRSDPVFSDAGGTGFSFQADLDEEEPAQAQALPAATGLARGQGRAGPRPHAPLQPEGEPPHYYLASTDIPAQKRFLSAIARRLDQLGALTKGQRDTANQGLFQREGQPRVEVRHRPCASCSTTVVRYKSGSTHTNKDNTVEDNWWTLTTSGRSVRQSSAFTERYEGAPRFEAITPEEAAQRWAAENAVKPPTYQQKAHMIVGAMLPIWDRLDTKGTLRVARTQTVDGQRLLGRLIQAKDVAAIRKRLNLASPAAKMAPAEVIARVLQGDVGELANGWKLQRVRVSDDVRIELVAGYLSGPAARELQGLGVVYERIGWDSRWFIPTGAAGVPVLQKLFVSKPLVELTNPRAAAGTATTDAEGEGETPFSRTLTQRAGLPVERVRELAAAVRAGWANAPEVVVLTGMADPALPAAVRAADERQRAGGARGTPEGFIHEGRVYLVASALPTPRDALRVLLHEALGHWGAAGVFGAGYRDVLRSLVAMRRAAVIVKAREYALVGAGVDVKTASDAAVFASMSEAQKIEAADEVLAQLAQTHPELGFVRRAIAAIRAWLREFVPAFAGLAVSDDEIIRSFILPARGFVERGASMRASGQARAGLSLASQFARGEGRPLVGYYSALERAIQAVPDKLATRPAAQWAFWLDANRDKLGIKREELEWSGLKDWLALQQAGVKTTTDIERAEGAASPFTQLWKSAYPGKVTKQDLLHYLREHGVQVHEVVKGGQQPMRELDDLAVQADALGFTFDRQLFNDGDEYNGRNIVFRRRRDDAVFQYTNDGRMAMVEAPPNAEAGYDDPADDGLLAIAQKMQALADAEMSGDDEDGSRYGKFTLPGGENYREVLLTLPEREVKADNSDSAAMMLFKNDMKEKYGESDFVRAMPKLNEDEREKYGMLAREDRNSSRSDQAIEHRRLNFRSSHWDEPNVIAHIRVNDRTDAEGRRVLFVEELQSDWAQQGRKRGFGSGDAVKARALGPAYRAQSGEMVTDYEIERRDGSTGRITASANTDPVALWNSKLAYGVGNIPRAPFVTHTEGWLNLALKRVLMMAVEGGYGAVAFVNGEQSADRYDLSKQVESVRVEHFRAEQGEVTLRAYDHQAHLVIDKPGIKLDQLDDYIGKDVADRARKQLHEYGRAKLTGLDLKVGGEGMRAFYDEMVPQALGKLLARLGGSKPGTVSITTPGFPTRGGGAQPGTELDDYDHELLGFTLTDKLRTQVAGGLPLFSRSQADGEGSLRAKPSANIKRLAGLLGPQLYGNMSDMGPVTVKELFQNSFDALKGLIEKGQGGLAQIDVTVDQVARTITLTDNGAGMTPDIINQAFLTIAGTNKETTRSSGGFGIAKMLFLFGNDSLSLKTVRDGVESRLDTSGEQLMAAFEDPERAPDITTRPSEGPAGTTITVKVPANWRNPSTGEEEAIRMPGPTAVQQMLERSPLFEPIVVTVNGQILPIGEAFPKDNYTTFSTVKFDWGTARIVVSKKEAKWSSKYDQNVEVLSNGLWQFSESIAEIGGTLPVPRRFYVNVEPRVKPEEPGYPFALNRQGFAPAVRADFDRVFSYLGLLYAAKQTAETAAGFGRVQHVDAEGTLSAPMQLAPEVDEGARQGMLLVNEGDVIEIHNGRMIVNGRQVPELTAKDIGQVRVDMSKFKIPQEQVDASRPLIHDNLDVRELTPEEREYARLKAQAEAMMAERDEANRGYQQAQAAHRLGGITDAQLAAIHQRYADLDNRYYEFRDNEVALARPAAEAAKKEGKGVRTPVTQVLRAQFGARFDQYLYQVGAVFQRLRDALAAEDEASYAPLTKLPVGVSFDQEYYGVHIRVPFHGMFLNPGLTQLDAPAGEPQPMRRIATAMIGTMVHELAHFREWDHDADFAREMQRINDLLFASEKFDMLGLNRELQATLEKSRDIYESLNTLVRGGTVVNRGLKLKDGSRYERLAGPAADVAGARTPGRDDRALAADAGQGAGAVSQRAEPRAAGDDVGRAGDVKFSRSDDERAPAWWQAGTPVATQDLDAASGDVGSVLDEDDNEAEWRIARVPVSAVVDDGRAPEPQRLDERLTAIRQADTLERPIYRLRPDGRAEIIDGWHRLQVAKERGQSEVEALVGRYPDAQRFSRTDGKRPATRAEIQEADAHQNDNHSPGDPGYANTKSLAWEYDPAYPVEQLEAPDAKWFHNEVKMAAEDGLNRDWDTMLDTPIREPIVVHENGGKGYIWDGYHRAGASVAKGAKTIPAIVGRKPVTRFSRTLAAAFAGGLNSVRDYQLPADYVVGDFLQSHGKLSWWHKTVGTQFNLAERNPLFRRVFESAQSFLNDVSFFANDAADRTPAVLPRLDGLRDLWKTPMSAADSQALAAPLFEGTLAWTRDDRGELVRVQDLELAEDEEAHPGVVFTPEELQRIYGATGERQADGSWSGQIGLYQQARAAIDKSITDLATANMVYIGGADVAELAQEVMAQGNVRHAEDLLSTHLRELAELTPERAAVFKDRIKRIGEKAERAQQLMEQGYAPLSRHGSHFVDVLDMHGERVYFGLFESPWAANRMARQMAGQYPGGRIRKGTMSQREYRLFAGVSPETLELFGEMLGLQERGDEAADLAFQAYIQLAKDNRSALKRLIHRKGIAGFSEDPGRVLAGFVYSNARQISANLHRRALRDAIVAIPQGPGELKDHAQELLEYIENPQEEAPRLRGWLFAQYLGGSVASMLVNLTQPVAVSFPWLSQYGIGAAARELKAAVGDALREHTGDAALDAALKKAAEDGTVAPQEVHYLQAQAAGRAQLRTGDGTRLGNVQAAAMNKLSKFMVGWSAIFGLAEQFNRRTTFIAAYRIAVAQGMADPAAFAKNAVDQTQFVYSKAAKPAWARGTAGSLLFTFKTYAINYVELLSRLGTQGAAGSPERAAGQRAALLSLALLFLLAGGGGLPFAEDIEDVIDAVLQRLGYSITSRQAKQQFFTKLVNREFANFMEHGLSGVTGAPFDVSGRLSLGNLVPGTGLLLTKKDHTRDLLELAGPTGDLAQRAYQAAGKALEGDVIGRTGALATLAPTAVRNVVQAGDMAARGMYRDDQGRKVIDTTMGDALSKAIGFQPNDVARAQSAAAQEVQLIANLRLVEDRIADAWAVGVFEHDAGKVAAAREQLAAWNARNPETPIRIALPQVMKRVQSMRQPREQRIERTAPPELRAQVRRELRAAREE